MAMKGVIKLLLILSGSAYYANAGIFVCENSAGIIKYSVTNANCNENRSIATPKTFPAPFKKPTANSKVSELLPSIVINNAISKPHKVNLNENYNMAEIAKKKEAGRIKILLYELESEKKRIAEINNEKKKHSALDDNILKLFNKQINHHNFNIAMITAELKNLGFF